MTASLEESPPGFSITPQEAKEFLDTLDDCMLIDIREPVEYRQHRIPGAILMPLSQAHKWWKTLRKDTLLIFYADIDDRAQELCKQLATKGFSNVRNIEGGIRAWPYDFESGPPE